MSLEFRTLANGLAAAFLQVISLDRGHWVDSAFVNLLRLISFTDLHVGHV